MAQSAADTKRVVPGRMNVYTVLALIGVVALGVGVGFVIALGKKLTNNTNPWFVVQKTADQKTLPGAGN